MNKITTMILTVVFCLALFIPAGCEVPDTKIYKFYEFDVSENISDIHTRGSCRLNPDYVPVYDSEGNEIEDPDNLQYINYGDDYPRDVIFTVCTQEEFDYTFREFPEVNLEKQMIILYYYTTTYYNFEKIVTKIELINGDLTVYYKEKEPWSSKKASTMPATMYFAIVINKVEFNTIKVLKTR